ncbi:MAG: hypothetical protein ACQEVA_20695 [Myxococcota bacterium]
MAEPRRIQKADAIYLVSNHTIEGLPLMESSQQVDAIITNNLAWAASVRGIELFTYHFLPDRFFMILSAPRLNRGKFMGDFQGQIAKQINVLRGRKGKFFAGRYQCSHLLDNNAIIEQLGRILEAPCRSQGESRNDTPHQGVSSWTLHQSGEPLVGQREDRTKYRNILRAHPNMTENEARELATTTYEVDLAKLPVWSSKTHMSYHRHVIATVRDLVEPESPPETSSATASTLPERTSRPHGPPRRQPRCITTDPSLRETFLQELSEQNYDYDMARARLRRGRGEPRFPHGMIPPHISWAVGAKRSQSPQPAKAPPNTSSSAQAA